MTNGMMKNIIGQKKSSFDLSQIIDGEKILLINLSKGRVGELNAQMLGLILMTKLQLAILKRANIEESKRLPFYLYVDEFQNLLTDAFISMLSESRKYGLSVHLTNQYIAQLPESMRNAILGNIGTLITFQIGAADAEFLKTEMQPLTAEDLQNVPLYNFYIRCTIDGMPYEPFMAKTFPPAAADANANFAEVIKTLCELKFGQIVY